MPEVADILRQYGPQYLERYEARMLPSHKRAIQAILACRTAAMGGELFSCPDCGGYVYRYHSCRNRACPKCHTAQTESWLEKRRGELIDAPYFHVVITIPRELHGLIRSHQRVLYNVLLKTAFEALQDLAWDPKFLGGEIAALCVLHTWTRTLEYHPHVHLLVPGVGLDRNGGLLTARQSFFVPVRALAKRFAGKFIEMARAALPEDTLIPRTPKRWYSFAKPSMDGGERVLNYLGRYVFRHAITNRRILSADNGRVSFRYQDSGTHEWKTMELDSQEFIRRFLQHVLPARLHKIRYNGLWHPSRRSKLQQLQCALSEQRPRLRLRVHRKTAAEKPRRIPRCPHCGCQHLSSLGRLGRQRQSIHFDPRSPPPPLEDAA
jgi:predicted RNA-binding Zn-ribbon protein involved in translation (DUF1610 family)